MTDLDYFRSQRVLAACRSHGINGDSDDFFAEYVNQLCCDKAMTANAANASCLNSGAGRLEILS